MKWICHNYKGRYNIGHAVENVPQPRRGPGRHQRPGHARGWASGSLCDTRAITLGPNCMGHTYTWAKTMRAISINAIAI